MGVRLTDLLNLTVESFLASGYEFSEYTLRVRCDPSIVIQLLAFKGMAYDNAGEPIHVIDWKTISTEVIDEVGRTLITSYGSFLVGRIRNEEDGSYLFRSGKVIASVQADGSIAIPDPREARKRARHVRETVLL